MERLKSERDNERYSSQNKALLPLLRDVDDDVISWAMSTALVNGWTMELALTAGSSTGNGMIHQPEASSQPSASEGRKQARSC